MSQASTSKIGLIGRIDSERRLYDGQTVKTRMMYRLLCDIYGESSIVTVDTYDYKHRAFAVMRDYVRCLRECDRLVVLLSMNGRRAFFPLLSFASKHLGKKVYHNLIGGWLASNLEKYPKWVCYLNSFEVNWVEAHALVERLAEKGVTNAEYLPNFKYLNPPRTDFSENKVSGFRFCTFSRVMEQKGVGDAAEAVEKLCAEGYVCCLDVYGPIDESYRNEFDQLVERCAHVEYKGCVAPEESLQAISGYDALLFPTKWKLEGIPGTIIDALSAGVPVIASKWQYYDEMLEDGVTGYGYEFGDTDRLVKILSDFMTCSEGRNEMRTACIERAKSYSPSVVGPLIKAELDD